jgi:hypothetical protein
MTLKLRPRSAAARLRRSPALIAAVAVAAAVPVLFGTVRAAIPDANGKITGCYGISGGQLRVIDTGSEPDCRADENRIAWNQTGLSAYEVAKEVHHVPASADTAILATCPAGKVPLGGGALASPEHVVIVGSFPFGFFGYQAWEVIVRNDHNFAVDVTAFVTCANP